MATSKYLAASNRVTAFFETNLNQDGQLTPTECQEDLNFYYKIPTLLLLSGRYSQAHRVLDHIKKSFMLESGDFCSAPNVKSSSFALCEFYSYINGWLLMAAQRIGRFDVSQKAYNYVKSFLDFSDPRGGFMTKAPISKGDGVSDIFMTAHYGMISLYLGDMETASKAGKFIQTIYHDQPNIEESFLLRVSKDGKLVSDYLPDMAVFHIVKKSEPNQLYFMLGYPAAFLAQLHRATSDPSYLKTACDILDFCLGCHESIYSFHFAHKLAWAASIVANITREEKYKALAVRIADFLLTLQMENGLFLAEAEPADRYDQSAEIGVWLCEIDANLQALC